MWSFSLLLKNEEAAGEDDDDSIRETKGKKNLWMKLKFIFDIYKKFFQRIIKRNLNLYSQPAPAT